MDIVVFKIWSFNYLDTNNADTLSKFSFRYSDFALSLGIFPMIFFYPLNSTPLCTFPIRCKCLNCLCERLEISCMETVDQDIIMNKISFFNIKVPLLVLLLTKLSMAFISTTYLLSPLHTCSYFLLYSFNTSHMLTKFSIYMTHAKSSVVVFICL